jgi:hypothetical protein
LDHEKYCLPSGEALELGNAVISPSYTPMLFDKYCFWVEGSNNFKVAVMHRVDCNLTFSLERLGASIVLLWSSSHIQEQANGAQGKYVLCRFMRKKAFRSSLSQTATAI